MADRVLLGRLPDGQFGLRVSRPGYSVQAEPLGSFGIAFDSRLTDFGIIHQQGVMGYGTVTFPILPYVPLATICRIDDGNYLWPQDVVETSFSAPSLRHWVTPFVGLVTSSSLTIRTLDTFYGVAWPATRWLYTIYAIEV